MGVLEKGLIVGVAVLLRCSVSYHSYSGQEKAPMYGDYEAQRHWQEITLNLPVQHWYTNTTDNDLLYWGLDYPPLTAYHSLIIAKIAYIIDPDYVKISSSRGYESTDHKYFMRLTVLTADIIIYVSSVIWFVSKINHHHRRSNSTENVFKLEKRHFILATALLYPGIVLVDHGHFQYNCVSLGLFVAAVTAIFENLTIIGSFLFVLALNYKQMELYHALPFFFYILGNNNIIIPVRGRKSLLSSLRTLICVALTVIITFIAIWAPFIHKLNIFVDVVTRLFPFARGLFEDKVGNIWCALNVIVKFRNFLTNYQLARVSLIATALTVLPSCLDLYLRPTREKFLVSLINSALGFYLLSFQVHEKSILLAAIPVVMYFHKDPLACFWFLLVSTFSIFPLLIKDGLCLVYASVNLFYGFSVYLMWPLEFFVSISGKTRSNRSNKWRKLMSILFLISVGGIIAISIACIIVEPPNRYPDLFPLLVAIYSCVHFIGFFCYFNYRQICVLHS